MMAEKESKQAFIFRTKLVSKPQQVPWHTESTYRLIIKKCFKSDFVVTTIRNPREYRISSDELHDKMKRLFQRVKRSPCLLIDFSSVPVTADGYAHRCDDLCRDLQNRIDQINPRVAESLDIIIIASDVKEFCGSVRLEDRLIPSCRDREIGLVVIALTPEPQVRMLHNSGRFASNIDVNISNIVQEKSQTEGININPDDEIRESIDTVCGHFELSWPPEKVTPNGMLLHVPALVSLARFSSGGTNLTHLQNIFVRELQSDDFVIHYFGIEDMKNLALAIVNNENSRLASIVGVRNRKVAIVCDILWELYGLEDFVQRQMDEGAVDVFTVGFVSYAPFRNNTNIRYKCFLDLDFEEYQPNEDSCPFCRHEDAQAIKGDYLEKFLGKIYGFETHTFWEIVSNTEGAYTDGHWPSPRTGYHYLHRINTLPILEKHGYCISCRIRNLLAEHIHNEWIDAILCPAEPEAVRLSELLSRALHLKGNMIVKVHRKYFHKVTKASIPDELNAVLSQEYGESYLKKWNIIIVDQAAHHFQTVSALSHLCRFRGARILAFAVLIDRLHHRVPVSECLHSSHYISLYKWPWPPFKGDECPCTRR